MQFNQTNNNAGDVNNAVSLKGNVVQTVGDANQVKIDQPQSLWSTILNTVKTWWKWLIGHF